MTTAESTGLIPLLNRLGDLECQRILVEGGPKTVYSFLAEGLVDEFYLVQSNVIHQQPIASNIDDEVLSNSGLAFVRHEQWGDEAVSVWTRTPLE